jgi:MFS family permease
MGIMQLLNIFLFGLFCGVLASYFATKRGRYPLGWFLIGFFLGAIGVLLLFVLPKVEKSPSRPPQKSLYPHLAVRSEAWLKMWYYLDPTHKQQGPFEFPDLIKKWKEKGICETSYIWGEGMPQWRRLSDLPDLLKEIDQA